MLLTAVCFLPSRPAGHRQRLLLAVAEEAVGPYVVLGAAVTLSGPPGGGGERPWECRFDTDGLVHFIYQERAGDGLPWRIRRATAKPAAITAALHEVKPSERASVKSDLDALALPA